MEGSCFRTVYHTVCAMTIDERFYNKSFSTIGDVSAVPYNKEATHAVVYGYVGTNYEITLEFLGFAKQNKDNYCIDFLEAYHGERISLIMECFEDKYFIAFPKIKECSIYSEYLPRINEALQDQIVSDGLELSRSICAFDNWRDLDCPDRVEVHVRENGHIDNEKTIFVWLEDCKNGSFIGRHTAHPFPAKNDEMVCCHIEKKKDNTDFILVADSPNDFYIDL